MAPPVYRSGNGFHGNSWESPRAGRTRPCRDTVESPGQSRSSNISSVISRRSKRKSPQGRTSLYILPVLGGREFRFGHAELGHVHEGGVVDIPFPRPVRDWLIAEALAKEHPCVPNSGWITFYARNSEDLKHALCLLRLSYLRYALKIAGDPLRLVRQQSEARQLDVRLSTLLEAIVAVTTPAVKEHLTA